MNQDFIVYMLKRKLVVIPRLTYKIKDEMNSQIAFPKRLKRYSLTLYAV